eukprot:g17425.t1
MLISFCADCLDDANLWTVLFCCFYYPFFYDAEKAGRSRREREAREAAEFDARRGQTPAVNSDLAGPDRQYMSDDRPVHQQQRPPASETSPSWDQQPGAVQTPIMHPPPGMAHQPVMHPPPGVAQVATPIAQPINPQREGQPASSSNTLTGGDVAAAAVKGTIAMGKIALGVLSAAGQAGAKYVAEEKARQKQASDSGGYVCKNENRIKLLNDTTKNDAKDRVQSHHRGPFFTITTISSYLLFDPPCNRVTCFSDCFGWPSVGVHNNKQLPPTYRVNVLTAYNLLVCLDRVPCRDGHADEQTGIKRTAKRQEGKTARWSKKKRVLSVLQQGWRTNF